MPVTLLYHQCGSTFKVDPRLKDKARFCSRVCKSLSQRLPEETRICAYCGESFALPATNQVRRQQLYCSRTCGKKVAGIKKRDQGLRKFWSRVQRCEHGWDCPYCCWPWQANMTGNGYGIVQLGGGKKTMAQRVAWELWNERSMPPELFGAHYCHTPACCNAFHVHPATQKENMADSVRDQRHYHGARHHEAKLTLETIKEAFDLRAKGRSIHAIAKHLGVSFITIQKLLARETWKSIDIEALTSQRSDATPEQIPLIE
jgi:hypothetical protein